jgi:hypothetical protein
MHSLLSVCAQSAQAAVRHSIVRSFSAGSSAGRFVGMTGAQVVHDSLREHNVDVVFGYDKIYGILSLLRLQIMTALISLQIPRWRYSPRL